MQRIKLVMEYDGVGYVGWQKQKIGPSIQGAIEDAIFSFCGEHVKVLSAGRTDSGVHAFGQVAHFECSEEVKISQIKNALNYYLKSKKISILHAELVASDFHARYSARSRTYIYRIYTHPHPSIFEKDRSLHFADKLDLDAMNKAAQLFIGAQDFSAFRAKRCQAKYTIVDIRESFFQQEGDIITYRVKASAFLYHMVRNIVGTLLFVGTGKITVHDIAKIIASKDRQQAAPTAKPYGLYLLEVEY